MPTITVSTGVFIELFGTQFTQVLSHDFPQETEELGPFALSAEPDKVSAPGLNINSFSFSFLATQALVDVLDTNRGATGTFEFRRDDGAVSATNPKFTGTCFVKSYNQGAGDTGSEWQVDVEVGFTTKITKATS